MIVLVIRTRQPFYKSRPSKILILATLLVAAATLLFPFTPLGVLFGFKTLPAYFLFLLAVILVLYIFAAEAAKKIFYRKINKDS